MLSTKRRLSLRAAIANAGILAAVAASGCQLPSAPMEPVAAPRSLRPCCAFGHRLGVSLAGIPIPIRMDNVVDIDDLGPHHYDGGLFSVDGFGERGLVSLASDGIAYTCRGGFVDTAHLRDYADWTFFLWSWITQTLKHGGRVELPEEGGLRILYVVAADRDLALRLGDELAISLAEWLAFELSVWHETATWYGWSAIAGFPEFASAFSPEDLYSNRVGIELAGEILRRGGVRGIDDFNRAVDSELPGLLRRLGVVPHEITHLAVASIDRARGSRGGWWNSGRRLPERDLVLHRNLDLGPDIVPWQVPRTKQSPELAAALKEHCGPEEPEPWVLHHAQQLAGVAIQRLARLDVRPEASLALQDHAGSPRWLGPDDLRQVVEKVRASVLAEFGPDADRP
jgi:hypothetical protein